MSKNAQNDEILFWFVVKGIGAVLAALVVVGLLYPQYKVYSKNLSGQAKLAEAEWTKQIILEDAKAQKLSATLLAEAEVERAKGVAAANEIIGDSLQGNTDYLTYLWIQGLQDGSSETIYIPTEANMPILEATRLDQQ